MHGMYAYIYPYIPPNLCTPDEHDYVHFDDVYSTMTSYTRHILAVLDDVMPSVVTSYARYDVGKPTLRQKRLC